MFSKVKHIKFHSYSGCQVKHKAPYILPENASHWERVLYLTAVVETGANFGSVMSYDGTGMTAGLTQCVAVLPRSVKSETRPGDSQGDLWPLMAMIRDHCPEATKRIDDEFHEIGWKIASFGKVIYRDGSGFVPGRLIREELTPNQGKVPRSGEDWQTAKGWALIFHEIFADPRTFQVQIDFAIEHIQKTAQRKYKALRGKTVKELFYGGDLDNIPMYTREDPLDLAMSVFFSHSVNGPAIAFRKLQASLDQFMRSEDRVPDLNDFSDREKLSRKIIRNLALSDYGRWHWSVKNSRYKRTLKTAKTIWLRYFFVGQQAIMPTRF